MSIAATIPLQAQGVTVLSNLGESGFGYHIGFGSQSFQTGTATGGYLLNSVTLPMGAWAGYASNFVVRVYNDQNGQPGMSLGELSGNSDPRSAGLYAYTAAAMTLNPGTIYWIVAQFDKDGSPLPPQPPVGGYCWQFTSSPRYASSDGWVLNPVGSSAGGGFLFQVGINAAAVPEPDSLTLLVVGVANFLFWCRRRHRGESGAERGAGQNKALPVPVND